MSREIHNQRMLDAARNLPGRGSPHDVSRGYVGWGPDEEATMGKGKTARHATWQDMLGAIQNPAREIHDLRHLGLGHLERVDPTFPNTMVVNVEHDARRLVPILLKEAFEHVDNELHRCVVVVEKKHAVKAWLLRLGACSGNDRCTASARAARLVVALHSCPVPRHCFGSLVPIRCHLDALIEPCM